MSKSVVYERDLLYPTQNLFEPGSIHVEILNPNKSGKMPIIIEGKTNHSPVNYIDTIIKLMQNEIFDRIHINIKDNTNIFIKVNELVKDFGESKYIKVVFNEEKFDFEGVSEVEV